MSNETHGDLMREKWKEINEQIREFISLLPEEERDGVIYTQDGFINNIEDQFCFLVDRD